MAEQISAGELIVDVAADVSELKAGFAEVRNTLKQGNKKVGAFEKIWTGALRRVGEKATDFAFKAIKAPFSIALKSVVGMGKGMANLAKTAVLDAAQFQTRLAEVATLGVERMDKLRDGILEVSAAIGQDLPTATQAAYQAISAGIPEGNVIDFLSIGAKAAVAGVTDMETAVDALSTVVNAYGADVSEASKFSDQFFEIIRLGKTTFPELAASIGMVLPTAAAVGVSFDEVGGALALMTQKGINTSQAVTSLNALLIQLLKPAEGAADAVGRITDAAGGLADLDLSKVIDELAKLDTKEQLGLVGSIEAVKALLSLQDAGLGEAIKSVSASLGATEEAFSKFEGTFEFEKGKLFQSLINFGTELATPVAEAIGEVFEQINEKISPNLAPLATVIRDWFTSIWEGGADAQSAQQMADGMGIGIREAFNILGGDKETAEFAQILADGFGISLEEAFKIVGTKGSLKSEIFKTVDTIGTAMVEGFQAFLSGDQTFFEMVSKWSGGLAANIGDTIGAYFETEFAETIRKGWDDNKDEIFKISTDVGSAIGTAIVESMGTASAKAFEAIYLSFGGLIFNLTEAFTTRLDRLVRASQGRGGAGAITQGANSIPGSILPPSASPARIKAPVSAIQQLSAPSMNQGSGGGGIGGGQPINITINQAASEDSQSMVNRLREMLLDIERFGNTRGLVAGQAHG